MGVSETRYDTVRGGRHEQITVIHKGKAEQTSQANDSERKSENLSELCEKLRQYGDICSTQVRGREVFSFLCTAFADSIFFHH